MSQHPSVKQRNDTEWNSYKENIRIVYLDEGRTLKDTMSIFEIEHAFKKSERSWKSKLKEWNFDKYIPAQEMQFMVGKAEKRKVEDGKDTLFSRGGNHVSQERLDQFKKRRINGVTEELPILVRTPPLVTYHTPGKESNDVSIVVMDDPSSYPHPTASRSALELEETLIGKVHETVNTSLLSKSRTATHADPFGMSRTVTLNTSHLASSFKILSTAMPPPQRSPEASQREILKQNIIIAREMRDQNNLEAAELAEAQYLQAMRVYLEISNIWNRLQQQCLEEICQFLQRDRCNVPELSSMACSRQLCELTSTLPPQARLESLNTLATLLVRDKQYDEAKKVYYELIGLCRDLNEQSLRWRFQGLLGKALYWDSNGNDEECLRLLIFDLADALSSEKRSDSWRLPATFVQATIAGEIAVSLDESLSTILISLRTLSSTTNDRGLPLGKHVLAQIMDLSLACSKYHFEKQSLKHESSWDEASNALSSAVRSLTMHMSDLQLEIHMEAQLSSCLNFKQLGDFQQSAEALAAAFDIFELRIKVNGIDTVMLDRFKTARSDIPLATIEKLDYSHWIRIVCLDAILPRTENVGHPAAVDKMATESQNEEHMGNWNGSDDPGSISHSITRSEDKSSKLSAVSMDISPGWESANKYGVSFSDNMSAVMSGVSFNYADFFP